MLTTLQTYSEIYRLKTHCVQSRNIKFSIYRKLGLLNILEIF